MDREDWQKAKSITIDLIGLPSSERDAYLANLDIKPEIRREIDSLLRFETTAENWSLPAAIDLSKESFSDEPVESPSLAGTRIGAYEIKAELGSGGMGAVYLAERSVGRSTQKVAVKLLRREMNTAVLRRRFRREQEILAGLEHPNIARLLDTGTTDEGIPYLVMEYAEGTRIDQFCVKNELGLTARLKLFNKVCDAVSFAHQNLIIHRDIKPSNIIVSTAGEPKLLDFGISKLIDDAGETSNTITKLRALTPEYASPEQIEGKAISTATDIYSLGVVLFKVLTGTLPFGEASRSELLKEITDSEPEPPSSASEKAHRSAIHARQLRGDIDNIILKALRLEPDRRYRTVEQFSADIWRFIDGLPVTARPATLGYRASKYYRRNKIPILASALVTVSLIAGTAVAVWQAGVAREQARMASVAQQKAETESLRSKQEQERAKKIMGFMERIIAFANPGQYAPGSASKGEARVIDALDALSDDIDKEFPYKPDIRAELHHKFAEVYTIRYSKIKEKQALEKAIDHAQRAIELRKEFFGEKHELVAKDMYYLWASRSKTDQDDPEDLAKLLAEAIEMMRETAPNDLNLPYMLLDYSARLWRKNEQRNFDSYYRNAKVKDRDGRLGLAENYLEEALTRFREHYPDGHLTVTTGMCSLAIVQIEQGKFGLAEENFRSCRELPNRESLNIDQYSASLQEGLQAQSKGS